MEYLIIIPNGRVIGETFTSLFIIQFKFNSEATNQNINTVRTEGTYTSN